MTFKNTPTVVVTTVPVGTHMDQLLLIRRKDSGKIALPGGHQDYNELWQNTAVREVKEETGVIINPEFIRLDDYITVPGVNLVFCRYCAPDADISKMVHQVEEVAEVLLLKRLSNIKQADVAFPTHWQRIKSFFLD